MRPAASSLFHVGDLEFRHSNLHATWGLGPKINGAANTLRTLQQQSTPTMMGDDNQTHCTPTTAAADSSVAAVHALGD